MDLNSTSLYKTLKIQYVVFWALPFLMMIGFETDLLPVGIYADDARMQYLLETVGILSAIAIVPVSLKLFAYVLKKKIDPADLLRAFTLYARWSAIRLLLLEVVILLNLLIYYLTFDSVGGLCALIGATASFFCMPGKTKIQKDLNLE